jgi:hypothetical protein
MQAKGAFVYGAGADYSLARHISVPNTIALCIGGEEPGALNPDISRPISTSPA